MAHSLTRQTMRYFQKLIALAVAFVLFGSLAAGIYFIILVLVT